MMQSMQLGAYWGDRAEDLQSSAARLRGFLDGLANAHPLLQSWVSRRRPIGQRLDHATTTSEVEMLLSAGLKRKDFTGEVMSELGFSFGLWNERRAEKEACSLTGTCGIAAGNPRVSNAVSMSIPLAVMEGDQVAVFDHLIRESVKWWHPSWAWIGTDSLRAVQNAGKPLLGLYTYLSADDFASNVARLDQDFTVEKIGSGSLVRLSTLAQVAALAPKFQTRLSIESVNGR